MNDLSNFNIYKNKKEQEIFKEAFHIEKKPILRDLSPFLL